MKRILSFMMVLFLVLIVAPKGIMVDASAEQTTLKGTPVKIALDGRLQEFQNPALLLNGSVLVPLRSVFEKLSAQVTWENSTRTVVISNGQNNIKVTIDRNEAFINEKEVKLEQAPFIQSDAAYVPVRFISEALGAKVDWDPVVWVVWITAPIAEKLTTPPAEPFSQGDGFLKGRYDDTAVQPTGYNWSRQSRLTGPSKPEKKWSFYGDSYFDSNIAIASDGTIYAANAKGKLYALYPNGKEKWKYSFGDEAESRSAPIIAKDGTIYVGSNVSMTKTQSGLFALNPNGTLKWKVMFNEFLLNASPALDEKGNIFIGTGTYMDKGRIYGINPDGKIFWSFDSEQVFPGREIADNGNSTAPALTKSGTMFLQGWFFNQMTYLSKYYYLYTGFSSPTVGPDETIYFGTPVGSLAAMNPNGTAKWEALLHTSISSSMRNDGATVTVRGGSRISASPALSKDGTIYIGGEEGNLFALHLKDLEKTQAVPETDHEDKFLYNTYDFAKITGSSWTFNIGAWISTIMIGSDGTIYVGAKDGVLYAITPNGKEKWKMNLGKDEIIYNIAIGTDNRLYVLVGTQIVAIGDR